MSTIDDGGEAEKLADDFEAWKGRELRCKEWLNAGWALTSIPVMAVAVVVIFGVRSPQADLFALLWWTLMGLLGMVTLMLVVGIVWQMTK